MEKTCAYCDFHTWSDENRFHVCTIGGGASEMSCDGECHRFKPSRRGNHYLTEIGKDKLTLEEYYERQTSQETT